MEEAEGARTFAVDGEAYDLFMGRYSKPLAERFADAAGVRPGHTALDVGCGPGALTGVLVDRLGPGSVSACDPSPSFVTACAARHAGVEVARGRAEDLPFEPARFDHVLAQLVLHFVSEPDVALREFIRVARSGGVVGACVWDFGEGMEMLRRFWDAALTLNPDAPDEARTLRFGRPGELATLFTAAGLQGVTETTLRSASTYRGFDELWAGLCAGIGPAGSYCMALPESERVRLEERLFDELGRPEGPFTLDAVARCATGHTPASHQST